MDEPLGLYVLISMPSGSCKTVQYNFQSTLLKLLDESYYDKAQAIAEFNQEMTATGSKIRLIIPDPSEATAVTDFTIEGAYRRQRTTPYRVFPHLEEFKIFLSMLGRYSGGDSDFGIAWILKSYSDTNITRVLARGTDTISSTGMSFCGFHQPSETVAFYLSDAGPRGNASGLAARFLIIAPPARTLSFKEVSLFIS